MTIYMYVCVSISTFALVNVVDMVCSSESRRGHRGMSGIKSTIILRFLNVLQADYFFNLTHTCILFNVYTCDKDTHMNCLVEIIKM